jgi:hypothetical protein
MRLTPIGGAVLLTLALLVTPAVAHPDTGDQRIVWSSGDDTAAGSPSFDLRRYGLPAGVAVAGVAFAFASRRTRPQRPPHRRPRSAP